MSGPIYLFGYSSGGGYACLLAAALACRGHRVRIMLGNPFTNWFPQPHPYGSPWQEQYDDVCARANEDAELRRRLMINGDIIAAVRRGKAAGMSGIIYFSAKNSMDVKRSAELAAAAGFQLVPVNMGPHEIDGWLLPGLLTDERLRKYHFDHYRRQFEADADVQQAVIEDMHAYAAFAEEYPGPRAILDGLGFLSDREAIGNLRLPAPLRWALTRLLCPPPAPSASPQTRAGA